MAKTSSESSFDSGHSDKWSLTPSIMQVVNNRCNGVAIGVINQSREGVVTVTGPVTSFNFGYTEDQTWISHTSSEVSNANEQQRESSSSGYGILMNGVEDMS